MTYKNTVTAPIERALQIGIANETFLKLANLYCRFCDKPQELKTLPTEELLSVKQSRAETRDFTVGGMFLDVVYAYRSLMTARNRKQIMSRLELSDSQQQSIINGYKARNAILPLVA